MRPAFRANVLIDGEMSTRDVTSVSIDLLLPLRRSTATLRTGKIRFRIRLVRRVKVCVVLVVC